VKKPTPRAPRRTTTVPPSGRAAKSRMTEADVERCADALCAYQREVTAGFARREQREWSRFYLCGQLSNLERKTMEPMVLALLRADRNTVRGLQQFIGQSPWPIEPVLLAHQARVAAALGEPAGVVIVDGSGFPKDGPESVGVAPQYCGHLGKVANSQEGVFAAYVSSHGCTFLDARLYLPEVWFGDDYQERWRRCGIPATTRFQTEPALALEMLTELAQSGVIPFQWVAADEHFGGNPAFLDGIRALGKWYMAEVPADTRVWLRQPAIQAPGRGPLGRPRLKPRLASNAPSSQEVRTVAASLARSRWHTWTLKEGGKGPLIAAFAFLKVIDSRAGLPGTRQWLILRRGLGAGAETKYYLSNAPIPCSPSEFVRLSGMRWPIETAFEEGKGEVGMDHYETRTWRGWHHHMAQTFLAHYFLVQVRLMHKKSTGFDHGPSTAVRGPRHRTRADQLPRFAGHPGLSSTPQSRCLSISSQAHAQAVSAALKV
jgi:SRSO17 transposase